MIPTILFRLTRLRTYNILADSTVGLVYLDVYIFHIQCIVELRLAHLSGAKYRTFVRLLLCRRRLSHVTKRFLGLDNLSCGVKLV
jgi:hypothetical protein